MRNALVRAGWACQQSQPHGLLQTQATVKTRDWIFGELGQRGRYLYTAIASMPLICFHIVQRWVATVAQALDYLTLAGAAFIQEHQNVSDCIEVKDGGSLERLFYCPLVRNKYDQTDESSHKGTGERHDSVITLICSISSTWMHIFSSSSVCGVLAECHPLSIITTQL